MIIRTPFDGVAGERQKVHLAWYRIASHRIGLPIVALRVILDLENGLRYLVVISYGYTYRCRGSKVEAIENNTRVPAIGILQ